jgi:predicted MFS family arabinose efflux permease/nucleotide-binding universal stress UspA family protein
MNTRATTAAPEPLIALGLAAGPVVALGFTRFAYALLLPAMKTDLHWSFAAAGGMNSANAVGYILGAGSGAWWARRHGSRTTFTWAVALSAVLLLLGGISTNYSVLAALRFLGGLTTAVAFVVGSALATRMHSGSHHHRTTLLVALYMAGVGTGVVLAGIAVPAVFAGAGQAHGWRIGWVVLGLLAAVAVWAAAWAARQVPEPAAITAAEREPLQFARLTPTVGWYVLYGAGYVSYMTFVVALLHAHGISTAGEAAFFITLGVASTLATLLVWGRVIARLHGGQAQALISVLVLLGVLPVLVSHSLAAAFVSAVVFGASFMAGPTAVTVLARRMLPAHRWTAGIAYLTVAFSVGQAIGPLIAGLLSDSSGGITKGLWLSVVLLGMAGAAALLQREPAAPAWVITPKVSSTSGGFGRILLTIDGAPSSTAAEQAAVTLSRAFGARLDVVHVDPDTEPNPSRGQSSAGAVLDAAVDRLAAAGVTPVGHLVHAPDVDIADALAETVARLGTDLVIAAPHHRAHLQRWLEPSISEELADRAKAAVLLVA